MKSLNQSNIKGMTIDKKRTVVLPVWLISVLAPVLLTVIGYSIGIATVHAKTETDMNYVKDEVKQLYERKASRESVVLMQGTLIRIESKLDRHILSQD